MEEQQFLEKMGFKCCDLLEKDPEFLSIDEGKTSSESSE